MGSLSRSAINDDYLSIYPYILQKSAILKNSHKNYAIWWFLDLLHLLKAFPSMIVEGQL